MDGKNTADTIRILICEDDTQDLSELQSTLTGFFVRNSFLGRPEFIVYTRGEDYLSATDSPDFDIAFLDIFMDEATGMDVAKAIRGHDEQAHIIFLTTSIDYAVDSYDVHASGYLLKPLQTAKMESLLLKIFQRKPRPKVVVKHRKEFRYIYHDDIVYVESRGRNLIIHLKDRPIITINEKLDEMQSMLNSDRFLRCHQSFLVNMDYIVDVTDTMFLLSNKETALIRQRDYAKMRSEYHRYFVEHSLESQIGR